MRGIFATDTDAKAGVSAVPPSACVTRALAAAETAAFPIAANASTAARPLRSSKRSLR